MVRCGTIEVASPFDPEAVGVPSGGCTITSNGPYSPGDRIEVQVTVQNQNSQAAAARVLVFTDGLRIAEDTGQVPVGTSTEVTLSGSLPQRPGEFTIETGVVEASEL